MNISGKRQAEQRRKDGIIDKLIPGPVLQKNRRIIIGFLIFFSAILFFSSFFFPFWKFTLHAPQYPDGLSIKLYLNRVVGDVTEIDILNHYIGMKKLIEAAKFERRIALWGLLLASFGLFGFIFSGRKSMSLFPLIPLFFLFVFIGDLFFWLYKYGHELDPNAPIRIQPFTPVLFGKGKVGQFETVASFGIGFYIVIISLVLAFLAFFLRIGVCNVCPEKERCSLVCDKIIKWKVRQSDS